VRTPLFGSDQTLRSRHQTAAHRYEEEFLADMDALGVRPPDVMPRVSDYIPQIVAYIARIQRNGLAYERDGSVYFDTAAFECALGPVLQFAVHAFMMASALTWVGRRSV